MSSEQKYNAIELQQFITSIKSNMECFDAGVRGKIEGDVVLVIGNTGAGKSMIMNVLAQKELIILEWEDKFKNKVSVLDIGSADHAGEIFPFDKMKIGHDGSCTTRPNCVSLLIKNTNERVQFWDCPGFANSKGSSVEEISNMTYIHKILEHVMDMGGSVRLMVVQDHAEIASSRSKKFKDSIKTICRIFEPNTADDYLQLIRATTFVFNKVPLSEEFQLDFATRYLTKVLANVLLQKVVSAEDVSSLHQHVMESCHQFMHTMMEMHSHSRVHYTTISQWVPGVEEFSHGRTTLTSILQSISGETGLISKMCTSKLALKNFDKLSFALSDNTSTVVMQYQNLLQKEFYEQCGVLSNLLKDVFLKCKERNVGDNTKIKSVIDNIVKICAIHASTGYKGGESTKISIELIQTLYEYLQYGSDISYVTQLDKIKFLLEDIKFLGHITNNQTSGAYFTNVARAILGGIGGYASESYMVAVTKQCEEQEQWLVNHDQRLIDGIKYCAVGGVLAIGGLLCKQFPSTQNLGDMLYEHAGSVMRGAFPAEPLPPVVPPLDDLSLLEGSVREALGVLEEHY